MFTCCIRIDIKSYEKKPLGKWGELVFILMLFSVFGYFVYKKLITKKE